MSDNSVFSVYNENISRKEKVHPEALSEEAPAFLSRVCSASSSKSSSVCRAGARTWAKPWLPVVAGASWPAPTLSFFDESRRLNEIQGSGVHEKIDLVEL